VSTPGCIGPRDLRIWTKTWRKALVDENRDSEDIDDSADDDDDTDQPLDVGVARRCSTLSLLEASASWRGDVLLSSLSFQD
jgi:hypothetical protein